MLAGVGCGMFGSLEEASTMRCEVETFEPAMGDAERERRLTAWKHAVEAVLRA
jgi:glycerol kinase